MEQQRPTSSKASAVVTSNVDISPEIAEWNAEKNRHLQELAKVQKEIEAIQAEAQQEEEQQSSEDEEGDTGFRKAYKKFTSQQVMEGFR